MTFKKDSESLIGHCRAFIKNENKVIDYLFTENGYELHNDNAKAIRFYQKRGFIMMGIYINEIQESRKIKPEIPLYGVDNIPILREIEFEKVL